jgi:hypothetical protein
MSLRQTRRSTRDREPELQITLNLLIKKIKRVGHGFRNFDNYRLRLLLHCGHCDVTWKNQPAARLRARTPRFVAQALNILIMAVREQQRRRHLRHTNLTRV